MAQALLTVRYQNVDSEVVETVLFAGTTSERNALRSALDEITTRAALGWPLPPDNAGAKLLAVENRETDDDTIAPGDEVVQVSGIVGKAPDQLPA